MTTGTCLTAACIRLMSYFEGCERAWVRPDGEAAATASGASPLTHADAIEELDRLGYTAGTALSRPTGGGLLADVSGTRPTMAGEAWLAGARRGLLPPETLAALVDKTADRAMGLYPLPRTTQRKAQEAPAPRGLLHAA